MLIDRRQGKLIVIEGLDGSGKATQTKRLTEALQAQGQSVHARKPGKIRRKKKE